jgi:hypothetical protein
VHDSAARTLAFPAQHQAIFYRTGHLELLGSRAVHAQLLRWLAE